ncbi:MAG: energy transducer TonB [Sulfurimonas sp.]|nr:energy transducer TonB [Sulfurimonas sp.]MBU3940213.1 energy transducer TonB [bacterium]MBU4024748.1 energy transducer TonB [bacterium]MBU4058620.1 energy transducer TonB [bacterium]MBU4111170.1 energy transducer TonB [bacterium]
MKNIKNHLKASLWMLFGIFFVFNIVILMNSESSLLNQEKKQENANFEIARIAKPKPEPKPKPKPKPEPAKAKKSTAAPSISSSLSGIDTGLDAFMSSDLSMDDTLLGDVSKNVVMSEDSVDEAPKPTHRAAMEYPAKARKSGITGYVLMNLLVSKDGDVEKVKVLESQPAGLFDEVAIAGVKEWKFKPAQYQGQPVKVWAKQKISFNLQ